MAMSNSLRNKLIAAAGDGSMLIAMVFLGSKDGVEERVYETYKTLPGSRRFVMGIPAPTSSNAGSTATANAIVCCGMTCS